MEVFRTHDLIFAFRPEFASTQFNIYNGSNFFTAPYGTYWRFMKKLCMTELLADRQLAGFVGVKQEEIRHFLRRLLESSESGKPVDVGAELTRLTNNIICRMAMTTRCSGSTYESEEVRKLGDEIAKLGGKLGLGEILGPLGKLDPFGYGKKLRNLIVQFDELLEKVLREHENDGAEGTNEGKDLVDILLKTSKDEKAEYKLTRTNIKAFLLDIFAGGTDTSAKAMQWTLAMLINHPDILRKVRAEIEFTVGETRLVEESDIHNLPYLQAVIKETLRLFPVLPIIGRECTEDCKIGGYDVKKKSRVLINLYAIMRDPDSWEDPDSFRPERFLMKSRENLQRQEEIKNQSSKFLPFGGGRRGCPGASHAYTIMHLTVASMVQCFDWVNGDNGLTEVSLEQGAGFNLRMAHPLLCFPIPVAKLQPLIPTVL
nr:TPA_asm: hypothetical protein HUJ06_026285 [Nelumbo nucifera]